MQRHERATDTGGRGHGRRLRGRIARSVAAMFLGALGAVLLVGSAGFLFLAMLHPAGSQGWLTAMFCAAVTGGPGAFAFGHACRLVYLGAGGRVAVADPRDDEAMWLD